MLFVPVVEIKKEGGYKLSARNYLLHLVFDTVERMDFFLFLVLPNLLLFCSKDISFNFLVLLLLAFLLYLLLYKHYGSIYDKTIYHS